MLWKWYDAVVTEIEQLTQTTRRFYLTVNDIENFDFQAGQFVTFDLPISQKRLQRWRSYSIASAPAGGNTFELCIVQLENGAGTRYFFEEVTVGTVLKFKGANGEFTLPQVISTDLVMICTGTGIAPFRAMIHDIFSKNIPHKKIDLIFGTRFESDILYLSEWRELEKKHPEFSFSVALSREQSPSFYQGYVHGIYADKIKPEGTIYLLCGWKAMVDEVRKRLSEANVPDARVHYELYG